MRLIWVFFITGKSNFKRIHRQFDKFTVVLNLSFNHCRLEMITLSIQDKSDLETDP